MQPYFPGYIFIQTNIDTNMKIDLRWLPGVIGLVCFDSQPATVDDLLIEQLRGHLLKIDSLSTRYSSNFQSGDKIIITDGIFKGYEGIFDRHLSGGNRVCIL